MITYAHCCSTASPVQEPDEQFISLLPSIRRQAEAAFRSQSADQKADLVQEVLANCLASFRRLVVLGKQHLAYATPLAQFAIRQVRAGRRVGSQTRRADVMSPANRQVVIESLDEYDQLQGQWREVLVEDRHAGPAETAAARIDVAAWLTSLGQKQQRIAWMLAQGETCTDVARAFGLSLGRVSQLRREFAHSWAKFQREIPTALGELDGVNHREIDGSGSMRSAAERGKELVL